jgi:hypothetical protein
MADVQGLSASTLEQLPAAFNAHDLDSIMTFFHDDCELLMPRGKDPGVSATLARRPCARGLRHALQAFQTSVTARLSIG